MTLTINQRELLDEENGHDKLIVELLKLKINVMSDQFTKKIVVSSRNAEDLIKAMDVAQAFVL